VHVIVKKWGNSASVRIPPDIMEAVHLKVDEAVDVREEGGRIVIEPVRSSEYDLEQLLAAITPENQHAEVDFGGPVGKDPSSGPAL
jgi:antitoxin MazE